MGTTAEKLTYLNTTKGKIKDGINSLGGNIDSNTTFRDYATQLDSIYNRLPKVSGTGSDITLTPTLKGRLGSVPNGNTYQFTTTGKNLLNPFINHQAGYSTTINDITFTINEDGTITANGTASANAIFALYGSWSGTTVYQTLDTTKTYKISGVDGTKAQIFIRTLTNGTYDTYNATSLSTISGKAGIVLFQIQVNSGTTVNNYVIKPQIEEGSSMTSYEPYTGGQASPNPSYPQEIQSVEGIQNVNVCGKNFVNYNNFIASTGTTINNITNNDITATFVGTYKAASLYYNLENKKYVFSVGNISNGTARIELYLYKNGEQIIKQNISGNNSYSFDNTNGIYDRTRLTLSNGNLSGTNKITFSNIQLELGTTATSYQPYQTPQTVQIDLGNIKLYDGDKIVGTPDNWSIVRENGEVVLDGSEDWMQNTVYNNVYYVENFLTDATTIEPREMISDYFTYGGLLTTGSGSVEINKFYQWTNLPQRIILGFDTTNLATFKTWLSTHNTKVVYKLATPTTTPITDTNLISQLNALYNLQSYDDTTNISVEGDLPMILEVSALKGE